MHQFHRRVKHISERLNHAHINTTTAMRVNKGRKKADYKLQIDDVVRIPPIRVAESKPNKTSDSLKKLLTESILYTLIRKTKS
jgi:hypothetical protein